MYFTDLAIRDTLHTHEKTDTNVGVYGGPSGNLKWETGRTYAVQPGRGKKAVGRIRITKIRRERLQDIKRNFTDLRAEMGYLVSTRHFIWGSRTWKRFRKLWNSIYKKPYRWEDNPDVWVLEFELADG